MSIAVYYTVCKKRRMVFTYCMRRMVVTYCMRIIVIGNKLIEVLMKLTFIITRHYSNTRSPTSTVHSVVRESRVGTWYRAVFSSSVTVSTDSLVEQLSFAELPV